jgi:hypothetical protein
MHRATIAQQRVRMEGWRTGAAWLKGRNSQGGREEQNILTRKKEKKQKSTLDSYRPSHGRSLVRSEADGSYRGDIGRRRYDLCGLIRYWALKLALLRLAAEVVIVMVGNYRAVLIIAIACLNIFLGCSGLITQVTALYSFHNPQGNRIVRADLATPFYAMSGITILFLVCLLIGAFYLIRRTSKGIVICVATYVTEILYFLAVALITGLSVTRALDHHQSVASSFVSIVGIGNAGLGFQFMPLYPIAALFVLVTISFKFRLRSRIVPLGRATPD